MPDRPRRDCRCPRARHEHGTVLAYNNDGCRCERCATVRAQYIKWWRHEFYRRIEAGEPAGLVDGTGTRLRLQALAALGWSTTSIGAHLRVTQSRASEMRLHDGNVRRELALRVVALYDELWNVVPTGRGSERARRYASGQGWLRPLDLDDDTIDDLCALGKMRIQSNDAHYTPDSLDEIAIERAMRGDRVALTSAETTAAIAKLAAMRLTDPEIGQRLAMTTTAVCKRRERAGIASEVQVAAKWRAA